MQFNSVGMLILPLVSRKPAIEEVAVVSRRFVETPPEKVEVAPSPYIVVVAVLPIYRGPNEDNCVVEALPPNCCRADQIFWLAKLRSTLIVPEVVIGFVPPRDKVELGVASATDVTVPALEVRQTPLMATQPP